MSSEESKNGSSPLFVESLSWGPPADLRAGHPPLFENLGLDTPAGSWVAITGPSGVGKTTLLCLCAGLLKPNSGSVRVFGQDFESMSDIELSEIRAKHLGLIFQNFHLDDSRSTLENILLPGYFGNEPWHALKERAKELAELVGLGEHLEKKTSVLSGGQRQRVAICRALLAKPKLILADEPTGSLDQETATSVLNLLSQHVDEGSSLVCVTHNQSVLERADTCFSLEDRKLTKVST